MHAADVVETLPTARPDDDILSAVRLVCQHGSPGLAVADDRGDMVGCLSSVDLIRLALPRYLRDDPRLARVFDERHADQIATVLVGIQVRDVLGEVMQSVPRVRPQATVVELGELMARRCCSLAVVEKEEGGTLGIVTANRLLAVLLAATEDTR